MTYLQPDISECVLADNDIFSINNTYFVPEIRTFKSDFQRLRQLKCVIVSDFFFFFGLGGKSSEIGKQKHNRLRLCGFCLELWKKSSDPLLE